MTFTRPRPGPPRGRPETVTVELLGGPQDGHAQEHTRQPGEKMPAELADRPGYRLLSVDPATTPRTWRYAWVHTFTGQRRPCGQRPCEGAGCPSKRRREAG